MLFTKIRTEKFGDAICDFYLDPQTNEVYMTREQIGTALQYRKPRIAISNIHSRHSERLDKFSKIGFIDLGYGDRKREVLLYNYKGMMEIYRWSNQPEADQFIDWVWDVMDGLRLGETKLVPNRHIMSNEILSQTMNRFARSQKTGDADLDNTIMYILRYIVEHKIPISLSDELAASINVTLEELVGTQELWKNKTYELIDDLVASKRYPSVPSVVNDICVYLRNVYGFVKEQEAKEYRQRYDLEGQRINKFTLIMENEIYRDLFMCHLLDLVRA